MSIPASVLDAYGFAGHRVETVSGGLINATYSVSGGDGVPVAAVQRLHPVFSAEVNLDIETITDYLAAQGFPTPRLLRTNKGQVYWEEDGHVWRALSWVQGQCFARVPDPSVAEQGGDLVGRFHRALQGLDYDFKFVRAGVHDTEEHLRKLRDASSAAEDPLLADADELRESIFARVADLPAMPQLPMRICHGDLKISNLLFNHDGAGLCLLDLDTMSKQTIAYELGDALRSWGNPSGEDTSSPVIDTAIVAAAARGYARGSAGLLAREEIESVIVGLETICLELAARFCLDAFEDYYFGWDSQRHTSRRAHNIERACGQLALGRSVAQKRDELQSLWTQAF
jgi:Ser/Thr protein kinase RdoA (MazF antagonist)